MPNSSLSEAAAARRAPSLTELTEATILNGANPAEETVDPEQGTESFAKLRKPERIPLTPLHVNIPVTLDDALRACMKREGVEKTAVVQEGLKRVLVDYL